MKYKNARLITFWLALICCGCYGVCLENGFHLVADIFSPLGAFLAGVSLFISAMANKKHRWIIMFASGGAFSWVIGDILFYLYNDLNYNPGVLSVVSDLFYHLTSCMYLIGMVLYLWTSYRNRDTVRFLANGMLISVATTIIINAFFSYSLKSEMNYFAFQPLEFVYVMSSMLILMILLLVLLERGIHNVSRVGVLLFISFLLYGILDIRFSLLDADGYEAVSPELDVLFLFSIVLLSASFVSATDDILDAIKNKDNGNSSRLGYFFVVVTIAIGIVLFLVHGLSQSGLLMLFITGMAYLLLLKTFQLNDLNRMLIEQSELEKEELKHRVSSQMEELSEINEKLANVSNLDFLTGLKNRRCWTNFSRGYTPKHKDERVILYSIDVNYFKLINDSYGHKVGDDVLVEIGRRLESLEDESVYAFRMGGDQFLMACIDNGYELDENVFGEHLLKVLDQTFDIKGELIRITYCIGVAVYPKDTDNLEKLFDFAESARESVKHRGNTSEFAFFDTTVMPRIQRRHVLESKMQNLDYDEHFELYFQPQVEAKTGSLIGMEALLRWKDEDFGFVSPDEFIPIAEEMGVMTRMGKWITKQAMTRIGDWNNRFHRNDVIGINVSPVQLRDTNFVDDFLESLKESKVKPGWVDVEITEGIALNGILNNTEIIHRLKSAGLTLSVDDFGTGYAAFSNMISFEFDRIKIAKELVDEIVENNNAKVVVKAIITMAKDMHLRTIAEGVEDEKQRDVLVELGCDQIQGYYFGKPLPADEFEKIWL